MTFGPNHNPGCNGSGWWHSGNGYNRVKVCPCGAEDHDPDASGWKELDAIVGTRVAKLDELLREVAGSGVEHDDARIDYVTVQIDRETWEALAPWRTT